MKIFSKILDRIFYFFTDMGRFGKHLKQNFSFGAVPLFFTLVIVAILTQYSFMALEAMFYDLKIRIDVGAQYSDDIVLIYIDDESDQFLGEKYPYSYASHIRLMKHISPENPKIVNYFVNLLDAESEEEKRNAYRLKRRIGQFITDGGTFRFATIEDEWGEYLPPQELQSFGHSIGQLKRTGGNIANDGIVRTVPLIYHGEPSIHLWTANKYRTFKGLPPLEIGDIQGAFYLREDDVTYALFRYGSSSVEGVSDIASIPFHQVVVGDFPEGFFKDKIVLVGATYISNRDHYVLTPFNREKLESTWLNVHAQRINALIQNKTVLKIPRKFTSILSVLLALLLSLSISRFRPSKGLLVIISLMGLFIGVSYFIFLLFGHWLYTIHLILAIFIVYYIWIPFRAIGEYKKRFAVEEESKLLKKVENLKQNFISLMSHDLKTPVAKITGLAENMLKLGPEDKNFKKNLRAIIGSTLDLNKFISSILDLSKIESQKLVLNKTSVDITTIIRSVVEELKGDFQFKDVTFDLDLAPLYPIEVDGLLIKRVVYNLVENAIKYSSDRPWIKIKTYDDSSWVYIEITDKGIGIPPSDIEHIFEKFYRVKNDASLKIKGTGLGLHLVKYFVEVHGGTITVKSTVGEGTTFNIKLVNT
jgi:signal transduction histidine kinase